MSTKWFQGKSREERYAAKVDAMNNAEVKESYHVVRQKLADLRQIEADLRSYLVSRLATGTSWRAAPTSSDRIPDYMLQSPAEYTRLRDDQAKVAHLRDKAQTWVDVLDRAILTRDLTMENLEEDGTDQSNRFKHVNNKLDLSAYKRFPG